MHTHTQIHRHHSKAKERAYALRGGQFSSGGGSERTSRRTIEGLGGPI